MNELTIKGNVPLKEVLPIEYQKQDRYDEINLKVIERGLQNPILNIENADAYIVAILVKVSDGLGFNIDMNDETIQNRIAMCAEMIKVSYNHFSIEQIKHAFLIANRTEADIESYGKDFNPIYLNRVLKAYDNYIKEVIPFIENAERIKENRKSFEDKKQREADYYEFRNDVNRRLYYINVCKSVLRNFLQLKHNALDVKTLDAKIIPILSKVGLVNFTYDEKHQMKSEASELAKLELVNKTKEISNETAISNTQKSLRKRKVLKLAETLGESNQSQNNEDAKAILNIWWCRVGLQKWLIHKSMDFELEETLDEVITNIETLKSEIMTAFIKANLIKDTDEITFNTEIETSKILSDKEKERQND